MFTIPDAVTISLLLTDEGHFPLKNGSQVLPSVGGTKLLQDENDGGALKKSPIQGSTMSEMWLSLDKQQTRGLSYIVISV